MKKPVLILLAIVMLLSLSACGGKKASVPALAATASVSTPAPTSTPRPASTSTPKPSATPTPAPAPSQAPSSSKSYKNPSKYTIEGKWKNSGSYTFGQVQSGSIVVFDGTNCNFFSPMDTYAFYKDGSTFKLDCTSFLTSVTLTFTVKIVDDDHIDIYNGSDYLEMTRVG